MVTQDKPILVVGGGLAGMTAALHIAEVGQRVLMIDDADVIGGALLLLDKTFPTDSCGVCFMAPQPPALCPFIECEEHPLIGLLPGTLLTELQGEAGNFRAMLSSKPRYVDADRCTECGLCADACPEVVPSGHMGGKWLGEERKAIYQPFPQAIPSSYVIDPAACTICGACEEACPYDTIHLGEEPTTRFVDVAAVILSSGFSPNDAAVRGAYGYGYYPNVITSLEYERMLSTSSPSHGKAVRVSDGSLAQKIALIHCVGSRDLSCGVPYCSSTCCMIAAKQAVMTTRRDPDAQVVVFTMDVRGAGRSYEAYLSKVRSQPGITYRRSLVSGIKLDPETQGLQLEYAEDGRTNTDTFDLVVLEVGMIVPPSLKAMVKNIGVDQNEFGFVMRGTLPGETSRTGVYVAGALEEPKDIPATVTQAISAAAQALSFGELSPVAPSPDEDIPLITRDVYDRSSIGIFFDEDPTLVDHLDLLALADQARALPDVVLVKTSRSEDDLRSAIKEKNLTHIIQVSRSVRHHAKNHHVLEGIPITDLALSADGIFVDGDCSALANRKALTLLRMTVEQVRLMVPQALQVNQPEAQALVLGGGLAGLAAAHTLAAQGISTHLIERENQLGGWFTRYESDHPERLAELIQTVETSNLITIHLNSELSSVEGRAGHQRARIITPEGKREIPFGVLVIATGAEAFPTGRFAHSNGMPVVAQHELRKQITGWQYRNHEQIPGTVVMIQCVGEAIGDRPYCSRTCCVDALNNALALKKLAPETQIAILFRDMVTPGFDELLYTEARRQGIQFLRYDPASPPQVKAKTIYVLDDVLNEMRNFSPDLLVLSTGIRSRSDAPNLAQILDLPLDEDGFFAPINIKTQGLDLPSAGMYLAGLAGGPTTARECTEQGIAAGLRASLFLRRGLQTSRAIATVNERLCSGCGLCVESCPVGARSIDEATDFAQVDPWLCTGCGACTAICPNGASSQATMETRGVLASLSAALGV